MTSLTPTAECCTAQPKTRPGLFAQISAMIAARRQRAQLRELDDAILYDLGLSRAEIEAESRRALWDVPANWRR
ncbi:DUF1127 domain-containing protein [Oceaniglobus ichthyenteri]|uniref:DUF1127 domain-containing protein n=1 Tax=Oceaniglobus ichthyenteri TaxID=2136177 RepID=UPI001981B0DB|nr:DUF1127 domain-containing protein [Oceaniglobus ichthyenteri]